MAVNIVTGRTGTEHITSDDFRAMNASIFGTGKYVLDYGSKFEATVVTNNQIRIRDGMCMNQGTQIGIEPTDYEDIAIENGVSGANRNDLIVMRYTRNADTSIEKASLAVIKGTAGKTATDPSYNSGNILDGGDLIDDMPLYRVKIESLSIIAVEPLFVVFDYSHRKALAGLSNVDNTSDLNKPVSIATQKAIDDIEIGVRNLLVGTKDFNITNAVVGENSQSTIISEKYDGLTIRYKNTAWNFYSIDISLKAGTYTFSTYVKGSCDLVQIGVNCEKYKYINYAISSDWKRISISFYVKEDMDVILGCDSVNNGDFYACGWKLENGNKATPWTPAPEDTEAEIQSVDNKLTTNLLKHTFGTITKNGVTCTNNGDGTYTLNGTNNTDSSIWFVLTDFFTLEPNKKYKLVGAYPNSNRPFGDNNTLWFLELYSSKEESLLYTRDFGDGRVFTTTETETTVAAEICVRKGVTLDNFTFKPMLTTNLNATYDDFVPYTGSTGQINSDVAEVLNNLGDASYKDVSTSVTSGDSNLVTGDAVSKAIFTASNYEEGTFTGNLYISGGTIIISASTGKYRRVGNMVYVYIAILNKTSDVPVGMSGLPFPHLGNISPNNKSELFYYHGSKKVLLRANQTVVGNTILFDSGTVPTGDCIEVFGWYRINTAAL